MNTETLMALDNFINYYNDNINKDKYIKELNIYSLLLLKNNFGGKDNKLSAKIENFDIICPIILNDTSKIEKVLLNLNSIKSHF